MKKSNYEAFDALKVRLGGNDVRVVMSAHPFWKQVEFTATGLKKLRAALDKKLAEALREQQARNRAEEDQKLDEECRRQRELVANDEFERYDFGKNSTVADADGWETTTGDPDWCRNVYLENPAGGDSIRLSFHVTFENKRFSLKVKDVHCLHFLTGTEVGRRGKRSKRV